jgi:hypothetical protein
MRDFFQSELFERKLIKVGHFRIFCSKAIDKIDV